VRARRGRHEHQRHRSSHASRSVTIGVRVQPAPNVTVMVTAVTVSLTHLRWDDESRDTIPRGIMKSATAASNEANIKHIRRSGTVHTNGQELFYEIHGDGPPLVLVMGIGYDSSLWTLQQVPELSTRFQVVLLDNRDAGRSSRANHAYTIADMADDVAGVLDALEIPRTHLLGLSMGAMIGMEFALRHADRLDRLVLAGPGAAPARSAVDPIAIWNWVKANDPSGEVFGGQQFSWLFSSAFLRNEQAVHETIALLASNPNPLDPEAYDRQAQAYLQFDALDRLDGIKAPSLIIVGEQDLLTPPWVAHEVARGIPGARLKIVTGDGSSHLVPLERPDEFNQLVMDFLAH
jgi:3-oxoadipate enol-lactonase